MVPTEYEGLWRRSGIWRSNGSSDLTTQVWWFQSSCHHIDLRIPVDRVGITAFAGETVVEGERCEWRPAIAYPAIGDELDAGWMRFDDIDHLHETGLDNSYEEDWYREPTGPMHGARLRQVDGDAVAYLLISKRWLAWACGDEFTVFQREQDWRVAASNLPSTPARRVMPTVEEVLLWKSGAMFKLDLSPGIQWRCV